MEARPGYPYATWGASVALLGVVLALGVGVFLGIPAIVIDNPTDGADLSTAANVAVQLATVLGFLLVPLAIALRTGGGSLRDALGRLGVRGFGPGAIGWMVLAVVAYLVFGAVYVGLFGEPQQEDIAEGFGPMSIQVLLIVVLAAVSEELCFRGMLFGGLRRSFPKLVAALLSAAVFGGLHVFTGATAVPPLMAFGLILALLYERTGSILPGIVLHMLNNGIALLAQ